jgi:para-nitrobenzyl esterase
MISPLAKGLFHKAMVQSAGGKNIPVPSGVVQSNAVIDKLLVTDGTCKNLSRAADLRASMPPAKIEAYLRKKTGEQILQVMLYADGRREPINPFIDKVVIPGRLETVFESGNYNKVPVIIGNNVDEVKPFMPQYLGPVPTSSGYTWYNVFNVIGLAQPSMTLDQLMPPGSDDRTIYQNCAKYASLSWKATRVDGLARRMKLHQDNVYCYWFKWGGPGSGPPPVDFLIGAGHAFDIPFFFGFDVCVWGISATEANREGRKALTESIMSYVASFIASGNPNREKDGLPVWEPWSNTPGGPKSIIFDADFTQAKISMMDQEVKEEEVMAQIYAIPSKWERDLIMELLWNDMGHDLDWKL